MHCPAVSSFDVFVQLYNAAIDDSLGRRKAAGGKASTVGEGSSTSVSGHRCHATRAIRTDRPQCALPPRSRPTGSCVLDSRYRRCAGWRRWKRGGRESEQGGFTGRWLRCRCAHVPGADTCIGAERQKQPWPSAPPCVPSVPPPCSYSHATPCHCPRPLCLRASALSPALLLLRACAPTFLLRVCFVDFLPPRSHLGGFA